MIQQVDREILDHMIDPKNYGSMEDPDAIGIGENPQNGEKVIVYLRVDDAGEAPRIASIRFQAIGCMTTVVAGSIITEEARELAFPQAEEMISVALGMLENVPPEEAACSEMVALALQAAMDTWHARRENPEIPALVYKIENTCVTKEETAKENG
ncbi:iron-sulfur cluster assembly scaffold protein [Nitratifractor sp.]